MFYSEDHIYFSFGLLRIYLEMEELGKLVGSGLATIGLVGAGTGVGVVFGCLIMGTARNPSLRNELFRLAILGFALTEAVGLLALMMAFLIMFK